jgi:hypothetical protein
VQGINDLATPFFQVFLSAYIGEPFYTSQLTGTNEVADSNPEEFDPALLPLDVFHAIEADSFWCLSRLLDGIQDNYICAQPGIQRSVRRMAELVARIDGMRSTLRFVIPLIFEIQLLYILIWNPRTWNSYNLLFGG